MRESLSFSAQQWYDRQDLDAVFLPWQIPLDHKPAFDELIAKGYIIKQDGPLQSYQFAADIRALNAAPELPA